jgi:chromosome partitioning protein
MAHVVAFANHKGGVGKTTSVTNTAYGLMKLKKRVLVIDCDPQGNTSLTLGTVSPFEQPVTVEDLFTNKQANFSSCAVKSRFEGLDLIACNINASAVVSALGPNDAKRFVCFKNKYDDVARKRYDYILLDCSPSLEGVLLVNAMSVADFYVIPIESESMYALQGITSLMKAIELITESSNQNLKMLGAVVTMYDSRTTAGKLMLESIRGSFGNKNVFNTVIHRNTAINKANMIFTCVCDLDQRASGCIDYRNFAKELIARINNWGDNV